MRQQLQVVCQSIVALVALIPALAHGNDDPEITAVRRLRDPSAQEEDAKVAFGLGDTLLVTVANWKKKETLEESTQEWHLKLDGIVLPSVPAQAIDSEKTPDEAEFRFFLMTDMENRAAWDALLADPFRGSGWRQPVRVGIQPPTGFGSPIRPLKGKAELILISKNRLYPLAAFMVVVIAVLVVLGRRSNILRGYHGRLYSLGRAQMAWWFIVILGSYLFLGVLTFNWTSTIPESALILLGISATTALGSVVIDGNKRQKAAEADGQQGELPELIGALKQKITQADAPADVSALSARLIELQGQLDKARSGATLPDRRSRTFFLDLVSDSQGVSLHRFQNVIWTLVLGGVYALSVLRDLSMPEFSATLLSLMGISSGTYVAFKFPEK